MRTTLDIEDDVLMAAKEIARHRNTTIGQVLTELARETLARKPSVTEKNGVPQFPRQPDAKPVTLELVNKFRDELP